MRRPGSLIATVATVAAGLVLLTACTGIPTATPPPSAPPTSAASPEQAGELDDVGPVRYVALGDSFTAAPLVPVTDLAEGCLRSNSNYPSLLASSLNLELTDVSCSGATTRDLVRRQPTVQDASVPAQLDALDGDTDLVTLGIGGNDRGLFSGLVQTCLQLRAQDRTGAPCARSDLGRGLLAATLRIGENVEQALRRVHRRAPEARVILVGYPRIAPSRAGCPRRLPFATGDVAFGDRVLRTLDRAMRRAARRADADYLDLYTASAGHDVCSARPWVNGRRTQAGVALAFHPLATGTAATAALLEDLIG